MERLRYLFSDENRLNLITNGKNLGFAAGCNAGLAASTQPYILFLNPILQENSLQRMVQVLESDSHIGMVAVFLSTRMVPNKAAGGVQFLHRGGLLCAPLGYIAWRDTGHSCSLIFIWIKPLPQSPVEVEAISGLMMLVRREAIDDVGSWNKIIFYIAKI